MGHLDNTEKFIAFILRHHPEAIGIKLDEHGWAQTEDLISGIAKSRKFDMQMLEEIVRTDEKQRYSFDETGELIRANQGHSIPVDVELAACEPPELLYHGTGEKYYDSIMESGLLPKSRLYVHLSKDIETAKMVGVRHGTPVVFTVMSGQMFKDGYLFYCSRNGVWLTKHVPPKYLEVI